MSTELNLSGPLQELAEACDACHRAGSDQWLQLPGTGHF